MWILPTHTYGTGEWPSVSQGGRRGGAWDGRLSFLCPGCLWCRAVEVGQAATAGAASGGEQREAGADGSPVHFLRPCHQRLEEAGPQHLSWGQPPAPASQVLGPWGVGGWFLLGCFQVTLQSPQMVPGVGLRLDVWEEVGSWRT